MQRPHTTTSYVECRFPASPPSTFISLGKLPVEADRWPQQTDWSVQPRHAALATLPRQSGPYHTPWRISAQSYSGRKGRCLECEQVWADSGQRGRTCSAARLASALWRSTWRSLSSSWCFCCASRMRASASRASAAGTVIAF